MNAATLSGPRADRSMTPAMRASRLLGWVSFGIAAAELLAPRRLGRAVGLEDRPNLLRAYGARELVAGIGAHSVYPVPALWSRVAGDLLDLATLAAGVRRQGGEQNGEEGAQQLTDDDRQDQTGERSGNRGAWIAIAAVAGITVIDLLVASKLSAETKEGKGEPKDYGDRSGFPKGVEAARGAGIVRDAEGGKAGGAAAGDSSPAGQTVTGRSSTDLAGAPQGGGSGSTGSLPGAQGGIIGGQTMSQESRKAVPEPPSYTPA